MLIFSKSQNIAVRYIFRKLFLNKQCIKKKFWKNMKIKDFRRILRNSSYKASVGLITQFFKGSLLDKQLPKQSFCWLYLLLNTFLVLLMQK